MGLAWSRPASTTSNAIQRAVRPAVSNSHRGSASVAGLKRISSAEPVDAAVKRARTKPAHIDASELQRLCVKCPSIYWLGKSDIVKLLKQANIVPEPIKVHKIAKWSWFFATYHVNDVASARTALSTLQHRGNSFEVEDVQLKSERRQRSDKAVADGPEEGKNREAWDVTAPWGEVAYEEQSKRMTDTWRNVLEKISNKLRREKLLRENLQWIAALKRGQPVCELEDGIFCDENERDHYRNKSEFTIGMTAGVKSEETGQEESEIAIGYALGMSRQGDFRVGKVNEKCRTTSLLSIKIADAITEVVKSSGQPVYDRRKHVGYWRYLTVRESARNRSVIVMVMVCKDGVVETDGAMNDDKCRQAVVDKLREILDEELELGVYWQHSVGLAPITSNVPTEHVHGLKVLTESLSGLQFAIDPAAFFQGHTPMTERLYALIGKYAGATKETTLLDVCCGTGTIGLTLASQVRSVIGVDICEPAIENARANARLNNIYNATFIAGPVEKVIGDVVKQVPDHLDCVAVLDPPRDGVTNNVISAVRGTPQVSRVVYVACKPQNAWKNIMSLCRPQSNAFKGTPFKPVKAVGVDLFPHTPHGEMVFVLERLNKQT